MSDQKLELGHVPIRRGDLGIVLDLLQFQLAARFKKRRE